jgi:23S rRNA pseudouridine2605 synthase
MTYMEERLQKLLSAAGVCSRRAAETYINEGRVTVNGVTAQQGDKADPDRDEICLDGKNVGGAEAHIYLMLNKPRGYVTTSKDEKGRRTVMELTADVGARVYPIGRLDMDSEGLLLLTDDGEFANLLTHPKHHVPKIYRVTVSPAPSEEQIRKLSSPMTLDGYRLQPVGVKLTTHGDLEMRLHEGRNRQIRRMCESVGLQVKRLRRQAIGTVRLGELPVGAWRHLTKQDVAYLYSKENRHKTESEQMTSR